MNDMIGSTMNTPQEEPSGRLVERTLQPQDVLMGRGGACPSEHTGNDTFRKVIEDGMGEYFGTKSNKRKDQIAHRIVKEIKANSGLFVKKLKERDLRSLGPRTDGGLYLVVNDEAAITKVKQTFRYLFRTSRMPKKVLTKHPGEEVEKEHEEVIVASRYPRAPRKEKEPSGPPRDSTRGQAVSLETSSSFAWHNIAVRPGFELMFLAHACSSVLGNQDTEFVGRAACL